MPARQWPLVLRRKGRKLAMLSVKYDQPFLAALREFCEQESQKSQQLVSQAVVLKELSLERSSRLRRLYSKHILLSNESNSETSES